MVAVAVAYLAWPEVVRLQTLEHIVKIVEPAASRMELRSYTQHNSKQRELTGTGSHPVPTLVCALQSQCALSIDLSLATTLPAEHLEQPPQFVALPTIRKLLALSPCTDTQCLVCQRQAALPSPHPPGQELPAVVPVVVPAEAPPAEEPAPLSSGADASPVLSHSPRHPGLIPSAMEESTPAVLGAGSEAVAVAAAAEAPVSVPVSPSPLGL